MRFAKKESPRQKKKHDKEERDEFSRDFYRQVVVEELPGCCGVTVLYGWENLPSSTLKKYSSKIISWLKAGESSENSYGYQWSAFTEGYKPAVLLVSINEDQKTVMKPILEGAGFRLVNSGLNEKTGNNIHTYMKTLTKAHK